MSKNKKQHNGRQQQKNINRQYKPKNNYGEQIHFEKKANRHGQATIMQENSLNLSNKIIFFSFCILLLSAQVLAEKDKIKFTHDSFSGEQPKNHLEAEITSSVSDNGQKADLVNLNFTANELTLGSKCLTSPSNACRMDAIQTNNTIAIRTSRTETPTELPVFKVGSSRYAISRKRNEKNTTTTLTTSSSPSLEEHTVFSFSEAPENSKLSVVHTSQSSDNHGNTNQQDRNHVTANVISQRKSAPVPKDAPLLNLTAHLARREENFIKSLIADVIRNLPTQPWPMGLEPYIRYVVNQVKHESPVPLKGISQVENRVLSVLQQTVNSNIDLALRLMTEGADRLIANSRAGGGMSGSKFVRAFFECVKDNPLIMVPVDYILASQISDNIATTPPAFDSTKLLQSALARLNQVKANLAGEYPRPVAFNFIEDKPEQLNSNKKDVENRSVQFSFNKGEMSVTAECQRFPDDAELKITTIEQENSVTIQATTSQGVDIQFLEAKDPQNAITCTKDTDGKVKCNQVVNPIKELPGKKYQFFYSAKKQQDAELTFSTDLSTTKVKL